MYSYKPIGLVCLCIGSRFGFKYKIVQYTNRTRHIKCSGRFFSVKKGYDVIMEQRAKRDEVKLILAKEEDAQMIHDIKYKAFMPLYEKYQDHDTNPAMELIDKTIWLLRDINTDYFMISWKDVVVGAVRISLRNDGIKKISPIFILPDYQNYGLGTIVFELLFERYDDTLVWMLDTIEQEKGNCHFYEKLGFRRTEEKIEINSKMTIIFYEKFNKKEG